MASSRVLHRSSGLSSLLSQLEFLSDSSFSSIRPWAIPEEKTDTFLPSVPGNVFGQLQANPSDQADWLWTGVLRDGITPLEPSTRQKRKGRILEKTKHSTRREKEVQKEQGRLHLLPGLCCFFFPVFFPALNGWRAAPFFIPWLTW